MRKKIPMPVWTIVLFLVGIIVSITVYAYSTDNVVLKQDINRVEKRVSKLESCSATKNYVDEKVEEIGSLQEAKMENLNTKIEAVKESTDRTEKMVGRLLDIQLNK